MSEFLSNYSLTEIVIGYYILCAMTPLVCTGLFIFSKNIIETTIITLGAIISVVIVMVLAPVLNNEVNKLSQELTHIKIAPAGENRYSVYIKNDKFIEKKLGNLILESNEEKWKKIGFVKCKSTIKKCIDEIKSYEQEIALNKSLDNVIVKN